MTRLSRGSSDSTSASNDRRRVPSIETIDRAATIAATISALAMRPPDDGSNQGSHESDGVCYILRA